MMKQEPRSMEWWLDRVDGAFQTSDGWKAKCPAHHDVKASLSLRENDGDTLVNCFAGCEYSNILKAIENGNHKVTIRTTSHEPQVGNASQWWEEYTQVPNDQWEKWGVTFEDGLIVFNWKRTQVHKTRTPGRKEFKWVPSGFAAPPLWPDPGDKLPNRIYVTEGETDCGVLRNLGLEAFTITKGAETPKVGDALHKMKSMGVQEVAVVLDNDEAGQKAQRELVKVCSEVGLTGLSVDLNLIMDPLCGEKDLRDIWLRINDKKQMLELINTATPGARAKSRQHGWKTLDQFLASPITESKWLVNKVILTNTVGMIVGSPKMGKSWLALDMGISVASGKPFLGMFDVIEPGPVVIISKEDPDHLLQDRFEKILISKGCGGKFDKMKLIPPKKLLHPVYLDLTREFLFTDKATVDLITRLETIKEQSGGLALVIFDPTLRMLTGVDEYKATEIAESVFATAQKIQTKLGAGVLLIHHRSKGGSEGKSSYGSMAFHAFSESTLYLKGEQPDNDGWVNVEGEFKSAATTTWSYRFLELDKRYEVEVSEAERAKGGMASIDVALKVLELLTSIPDGLTITQLGEGIPEVKDSMVRATLKQMEQAHKVRREKIDRQGARGPRVDRWIKV